MHDFFVDRLVGVKRVSALTRTVATKAALGGGGVHGVPQQDVRGGNAVNLAHALARLGLRTLLITHSDPSHERLLRDPFEGLDAEVRAKPGRAGLTVAVEGEVNVMLGDAGGAGDFGPERLDGEDWRALRGARVVCSVNWAANRKGTELLASLKRRLGESKTVFLDPADFRDRLGDYRALLARLEAGGMADWVSLNEHEAAGTARLLGAEAKGPEGLCRALAKELGVSLDVHTETGSFTSDGSEEASFKNRTVAPRRLTGAGDVWNAASIYGRLRGMGGAERLRFAHAAALLYIRAPEPLPPALDDVLGSLG